MMATSWSTTKISCKVPDELPEKLYELMAQGKKIIEVRPCTPDHTDTRFWYSVYYEYSC